MRPLAFGLIVITSNAVGAQWSLGGVGHFSLDERVQDPAYGASARIELYPHLRYSVFAELGMDVPRRYSWDRSYGERGALASGIAPFTRRQGSIIRYQEELRTGFAKRIGRIHRRTDASHLFWGASVGLTHRAGHTELKVTDIQTGIETHYSGNTDQFAARLAPAFGFRSRGRNGRFILATSPVLERGLSTQDGSWYLRYELSFGYLWSLGS